MTYQDRGPGSGSKRHIVIIGGGPAGCAAALTLLKYSDFDVTVIESTGFTQQRIGEVVSAGISPLLEYLGVCGKDFLAKHISAYDHISTWGSATVQSRSSTFSLFGSGWHLDRNTFDSDLMEQVERGGARIYLRSRLIEAVLTEENTWQLSLHHHGETDHLPAGISCTSNRTPMGGGILRASRTLKWPLP